MFTGFRDLDGLHLLIHPNDANADTPAKGAYTLAQSDVFFPEVLSKGVVCVALLERGDSSALALFVIEDLNRGIALLF